MKKNKLEKKIKKMNALLRLRKQQEEMAKYGLASVLAEIGEVQDKIISINEKINDVFQMTSSREGVDPSTLQSVPFFLKGLYADKHNQELILESLNKKKEEKTSELFNARAQFKLIEGINSRQIHSLKKENLKLEELNRESAYQMRSHLLNEGN